MFKNPENFVPESDSSINMPQVELQDISKQQKVIKYYVLLDKIAKISGAGMGIDEERKVALLKIEKRKLYKELEEMGVLVNLVRPEDYKEN